MEKNYVLRPWTPEEEDDFQSFCASLDEQNTEDDRFEADFETVDFLFDTKIASC